MKNSAKEGSGQLNIKPGGSERPNTKPTGPNNSEISLQSKKTGTTENIDKTDKSSEAADHRAPGDSRSKGDSWAAGETRAKGNGRATGGAGDAHAAGETRESPSAAISRSISQFEEVPFPHYL